MTYETYPLQFEPILKYRIWGGTKLRTILGKPTTTDTIGESWELSTVDGDVSIISNGIYKGQSLQQIINEFPEQILGTTVVERFGKQFPLLFKFIDANQDLSIQVHPNDELAMKRHNSAGKTEMWYIMQSDPGSQITVGFKQKSSPGEYLEHLKAKTLPNILNKVQANPGDVFFLETGTVHAIGAGILLAEIQQSSDVTYRIYDYDRLDPDGNPRQLHIDEALDAINYDLVDSKKSYDSNPNQKNELVDCRYFTTNLIPLDGSYSWKRSAESFTVFMCVEGSFELRTEKQTYSYSKGDTVLLPADMTAFLLEGNASILEIYIS